MYMLVCMKKMIVYRHVCLLLKLKLGKHKNVTLLKVDNMNA